MVFYNGKDDDYRQLPFQPQQPQGPYQPPYTNPPQGPYHPPTNYPPQHQPMHPQYPSQHQPMHQQGFPHGGPHRPPQGPPPGFIPVRPQFGAFAIDAGSIRRCLFRFTYIWPHRGRGFWFFPVFVGRFSISGYRWTGFNWIFFGLDLRSISSFTCH